MHKGSFYWHGLPGFTREWISNNSHSVFDVIAHVILRRISRTHYDDVIMDAIASQITSLNIVYSIVYSDADQRKHQSSASLAFVRGIHRGPVNSPHKWPVTRKMFPFDDVIMAVANMMWVGNFTSKKPRTGITHPFPHLSWTMLEQALTPYLVILICNEGRRWTQKRKPSHTG